MSKTKSVLKFDMETLEAAFKRYGEAAQIAMIGEEAAELTLAYQKTQRAKHGFSEDSPEKAEQREKEFIGEIADMAVVLNYAVMKYGKDAIQAAIDAKMDRLRQRVAD
jgi:phosphoribosyl-ATP pyrophosphohydrolase